MDDSAIICDEIIELFDEDAEAKSYDKTKTIPTNFNEKKETCKTQNFYFLIINYYSIIDSICCYLIKHRVKQKHLLLFHAKKGN